MTTLVVATFNTHWGVDPAGCPYDVVSAIGRLDADVVALQECWRPARGAGFAAEAARRYGYELVEGPFVGGPHGGTWRRVYSDHDEEATFGVAVLSRLPVRSSRLSPLGKAPFDMHRALLTVELDLDGSRLTFGATHLCYLPHGALWQLLLLSRLLRVPGPALLAGDFNMWGPVVEGLMPGWRRAAAGKTWPSHHPHSQIDHVLASGGATLESPEVLAPQGSDHRPLRVTALLR